MSAGYQHLFSQNTHSLGVAISIEVPLIFWSTHQPVVNEPAARSTYLSSELQLAHPVNDRVRRTALQRLTKYLETLNTLHENNTSLTSTVETAYKSGEIKLHKLLDIYKSNQELQGSVLKLQWEARQALIEWKRLRNEQVKK